MGEIAGNAASYFWEGLHAERPDPTNVAPGTVCLAHETDTGLWLSWNGAAWETITAGGGMDVTDGTTDVTGAAKLFFQGPVVEDAGTTGGVRSAVIAGPAITDGTTSLDYFQKITFPDGSLTGGSDNVTYTAPGASGGAITVEVAGATLPSDPVSILNFVPGTGIAISPTGPAGEADLTISSTVEPVSVTDGTTTVANADVIDFVGAVVTQDTGDSHKAIVTITPTAFPAASVQTHIMGATQQILTPDGQTFYIATVGGLVPGQTYLAFGQMYVVCAPTTDPIVVALSIDSGPTSQIASTILFGASTVYQSQMATLGPMPMVAVVSDNEIHLVASASIGGPVTIEKWPVGGTIPCTFITVVTLG